MRTKRGSFPQTFRIVTLSVVLGTFCLLFTLAFFFFLSFLRGMNGRHGTYCILSVNGILTLLEKPCLSFFNSIVL